jgi:type VI secretion system protein ImpH
MRHPSADVVKIARSADGPIELTVSFLGLTGPMGVLPDHYTEFLVRESQARNLAPVQFFDIFNHRLISLFYRAWAKYRVLVRVEESPGRLQDPFARALASLAGLGLDRQLAWLASGEEDLLSVAGGLSRRVRSAGALGRLITELYGVPSEVVEFAGRWLVIPPSDRTRLSAGDPDGAFASLGRDAVLGEAVWDVQSRVQVRLGPLGRSDFDALYGHEGRLGALQRLVLLALGPSIDFEIILVLKAADVPRSQLTAQGSTRLGQTGWLLQGGSAGDRAEARLLSSRRRR